MVKVKTTLQLGTATLESTSMEELKGMACTFGRVDISIQDSSLTERRTDKAIGERAQTRTATNTQANTK
jgi:hypothetical protein